MRTIEYTNRSSPIFEIAWHTFGHEAPRERVYAEDQSEGLFFYSVGPRVYGVLLLRSDRAKWLGSKRPTKPTNSSNRSTDCTVLLLPWEIHGRTNGPAG